MEKRYVIDVKKLKTGDVILVSNFFKFNDIKTYLYVLIQTVTNSEYNHCAIVLIENDQVFIVEANEKGVVKTDFDTWYNRIKRKFTVLRLKSFLKYYTYKDIIEKVNQNLGKKYDYESLVFYQLIYHIFSIWLGRTKKRAEKRLYCYELIAYTYQYLFPLYWKIKPNEISKSKHFNNLGTFLN